jgi:FKBP-type peptidyl-prolyl cis-trans isomerase FkpA/FKBP-type peptidyl-prolyl cis-trans isomerase FklB
MRASRQFALLLSLLALGACQGGTPALDTDERKASYGLGFQMGGQLNPAQAHIDLDAFVAGIKDGIAGAEAALSDSVIQAAFDVMSARVADDEMARLTAEGEKAASEGKAFLAENATKQGVVVTGSGLQYEVLQEGTGPKPGPEDQVSVNYKGTLLDGTQFDSSYDRGEPAVFGVKGVVPGFAEALQLMPVGSHYRFYIPSELGYGPQGTGGPIGPNATLIFEVELLEILK